MPEAILRLKPEQVIQEIQGGQIEVIRGDFPTPVEPLPRVESAGVEKAKNVFGENFLGEEAIHLMESKFQVAGVNVKFEIPQVSLPYFDADIENARQDEVRDRGRMVVLRPQWMVVKEGNKEVRKPVNILNLRELFKKEAKNLLGKVTKVTYDNNPFGTGAIFYVQDWCDSKDFAKESLKPGFGMPTREVIPGSTSKTWNDQQALLEPGERRTRWEL